MIRYEVVFVGDDDLPTTQDWAIVRTRNETYLFIKESRVTAAVLTRVWGCWQRVDGSGERRERLASSGVVG